MFERLKKLLGIAVTTNLFTPRVCLVACLKAIEKIDRNEDGMVNTLELLHMFKNTSFNTIYNIEWDDEQILNYLKTLIKNDVI